MSYITWFLGLIGFFALRTVTVDGYSRECDFNQSIFTQEGTTATFLYNITDLISHYIRMEKSSGSNKRYLFSVRVSNAPIIRPSYYDDVWKNRSNISIPSYSGDQFIMIIDLSNISMEDNGTYRIRESFSDSACYILYVMRTRIEPSPSQEENEPIYVFAHPHASLIKRPLTNATMVWLLDGKSDKETASFIEQGDNMWIPSLRKGLNGRNVTYRAIQDDGRITEVNTTIKVRYGPSHPLKMVPSKTYYNMMSGDTMPAIICTSECNPPCNVSWGEHSKDNILNKGAVTTEDTGEYTCTAKRSDGRIVEQIVSVFVSDNSNFIIAIACLASVQAVMILAIGLCTFFIYKRKDSSCCHVQNKTDSRDVTLQLSSVQGSENAAYEELTHETRNTVNNVYSETNLSTTEDRAVGMTYENTSISG